MTKREFIENNRNDRCGLSDKSRTTQKNSLDIIATDIYKKKTHFIFELIQNAEDNVYLQGKDFKPKLRFDVRQMEIEGKSCIVLMVSNNEIGFFEKHVSAICDVGKSTKTKEQGYIGEKGIGFKSVFNITSCPYVFSGGFQFCLPEVDEETGLGYIVPRWVTDLPAGISPGGTTILLPIKDKGSIQSVIKGLLDIDPETILFLRKLNSIEISVNLPETNIEYEIIIEKIPSTKPGTSKLVELSYLRRDAGSCEESIETFRYWLTEKEFDKPADVKHEKRQAIKSRPISIAMPMDGNTHGGKLFAYLPVEEKTGLPFLINGDFILTSSREDVKLEDKDSYDESTDRDVKPTDWNKWLRGCIVEAYIQGFIALLEDTELSFEERTAVYASIPIVSHYDFLTSIIKPIYDRLAGLDCVSVLQNRSFVKPRQSSLCPRTFRSLLSITNTLPILFQDETRIVCPELEKYYEQLIAIGVKPFALPNVISCLEDVAWVQSHPLPWFVDLFRYLDKKFKPEVLDCLSIVPVEEAEKNPRFTCHQEQPIYFSIGESEQNALAHVPAWLSELVPISSLDSEFMCILNQQEDQETLKKWLSDVLSVKEFSLEYYCMDILSKLATVYEQIENQQLIEATVFLEQYSGPKFDCEMLPVILSDGRKILLRDLLKLPIQVVVPESYDPKSGWQHIWPQKEDRTHFVALADEYSVMAETWFSALKIKRYPSFQKVVYASKEAALQAPEIEKKLYFKCYVAAADKWKDEKTSVSSFIPPSTLTQQTQDHAQREALFLSLLSYLGTLAIPESITSYALLELGLLASGTYKNNKEGHIPSETSHLLEQLRNHPWVLTPKGYFPPYKVFLAKESIKEVLEDTVPYLEGQLSNNAINLLRIRTDITINDLLELLNLSSGNQETDPAMVERIYTELSNRADRNPKPIKDAFASDPLIFLRDKEHRQQWLSLDECVWEDATDVFDDEFTYLQCHYPNLKDFFITRLGIHERVDSECFARRWLKIQGTPLNYKNQLRTVVERLYRELKPIAQQSEKDRPEWWGNFVKNAKIYTQADIFVAPNEVVLPDDGGFKEIFLKCPDVQFTWRPGKDVFGDWLLFYRAFNVPLLSESVSENLEGEVNLKPLEANKYVTVPAIKMIAAWLRERRRDDYERLLGGGKFQQLLSLREATTFDNIEVEFVLKAGTIHATATAQHPVFWENGDNVLLYQEGAKKSQLARALAKGLIASYKDLAHWIELILGSSDIERLKEENWNVPQDVLDLCRSNASASDRHSLEKVNPSPEIHPEGNSPDTQAPRAEPTPVPFNSTDRNSKAATPNSTSSNKQQDAETSVTTKPEDEPLNNGHQDKSVTASHQTVTIDYWKELQKSFNQDGRMEFSDEYKERIEYADDGEVGKPHKRGEGLKKRYSENIQNEPLPEDRRKDTERSILEGPNEAVRGNLYDWYHGQCQICGKTWPKRDGRAFFIAAYLFERHQARWVDEPGNAVCLCAEHFAQWRHAAKKTTSDVTEQILRLRLKAEEGDGDLSIRFRMLNDDCSITYNERHLLALRKFLELTVQGGY